MRRRRQRVIACRRRGCGLRPPGPEVQTQHLAVAIAAQRARVEAAVLPQLTAQGLLRIAIRVGAAQPQVKAQTVGRAVGAVVQVAQTLLEVVDLGVGEPASRSDLAGRHPPHLGIQRRIWARLDRDGQGAVGRARSIAQAVGHHHLAREVAGRDEGQVIVVADLGDGRLARRHGGHGDHGGAGEGAARDVAETDRHWHALQGLGDQGL
ncbi:hypothetical protein D3C72_1103130 [compost metagenome]